MRLGCCKRHVSQAEAHLFQSMTVDKGTMRAAKVDNAPCAGQTVVAYGRMQARDRRVVQHSIRQQLTVVIQTLHNIPNIFRPLQHMAAYHEWNIG